MCVINVFIIIIIISIIITRISIILINLQIIQGICSKAVKGTLYTEVVI